MINTNKFTELRTRDQSVTVHIFTMAFQSTFISAANKSIDENSSWIYLVDWILALILGLAFVFYFGRLVGFVCSQALKLIIWKKYKVRINMESLRISFLGGRIFVKNLTIITVNQTISILQLNLTWRYWISQLTRLSEYYLTHEDKGNIRITKEENERLPARFTLLIEGLEIFMYNRTAAYDNMMDILREQESLGKRETEEKTDNFLSQNIRESNLNGSSSKESISNESRTSSQTPRENLREKVYKNTSSGGNSLFVLLRLLPLHIRIKKGAVVLGNVTTPSILVASYKTGNAVVDITQAPCILDNYRFFYNMNFERFQISMKPNIAYDKLRYSNSNTISKFPPVKSRNTKLNSNNQKKYEQWYHFHQAMTMISHQIKKPFGRNKKQNNTQDDLAYDQWRGLKRYLGDQTEGQDFLGAINTDEEYAKYSLILDSAYTRITYYYDSPGFNPISGDTDFPGPEFGIDMELSMATIHYGPWADKQRVPLQSMFFPTLSRDSNPTEGHNTPGSIRNYDGFTFLMTIKDELIFRVPTREPSKHTETLRSQNINNAHIQTGKVSRPFGWLELNMKEGSSLHFFNSYIATRENGWNNELKAFFNSFEVRSSVNHDVFFIADSHNLDCNVGFPLEWNGKCKWIFDNTSENGRLFFLREHTMLLSDIFTDFASGPPLPYELFRPFEYQLNWKFNTYKLYLNVNDNNIINNPLDFSSNKYVSFQGDDLTCKVSIPLFGQFKKSTTIDFEVYTSFTKLVLDTPQWHTANAFMKSNLIGKSKDLTINGSYTYFNEIEINASNHVVIKILGDYVTLKFYGFVVRYLFTIRENYVGENMHFKTFEEYTNELASASQSDDISTGISVDTESVDSKESQPNYWKMIKSVNDVDILFMFQVRQGLLLLPYNLYDCSSHVGLKFDSFDIDIRFTNYYSDLQADFSAISIAFVDGQGNDDEANNIIYDIPRYTKCYLDGKHDASIDGLTIHTHRMFGLPPKEITYYSKWDFATEAININSDGFFILAVRTSIRSFGFGFKDLENGLNPEFPFIPNAANFSFRCPHVLIKLKSGREQEECPYFLIDLDSILLTFNDMANDRYSERLSASIPLITFKILSNIGEESKLLGYLQTSLVLDNIMHRKKSSEYKKLQQELIRRNDAPYHRCPFILDEDEKDDVYTDAYGCIMTSLTLVDASYPLNKASVEEMEENVYSIFAPNFDMNGKRLSLSLTLDVDSDSSLHKMAPLSTYDSQEFSPNYDTDSKFKLENLIFDFGEIASFFTPLSLFHIAQLMRSFNDYSLSKLIDDLQVDVVKKLKLIITTPSLVDNIRFVTQEVNLKFGDFDVSDPLEVFGMSAKVPAINLNIIEPSLAFSNSIERGLDGRDMKKDSNVAVAFHLKEVFFSVSRPSEFISPLNINMNDIEFWQTIDNLENSVWSSDIENTNITVDEKQADWLVDYISSSTKRIKPVLLEFKKLSEANKKCVSELVYKISTAGRDFRIDHDPGVLTKPASVLRSQKDHIRFFDSWKVMTRLRHVFDHLPEQWIRTQDELFNSFEWQAPENSYDEVLNIFSQWRSWEVDDIQQSYFFSFIFSKVETQTGKKYQNIKCQACLHDTKMNLSSQYTDFVDINDMTLTYEHKLEKMKDLSNINLGVIESILNCKILLNIESYRSKISTLALSCFLLLKNRCSLLHQPNLDKIDPKDDNVSTNIDLEFVTNVNKFQQKVVLPITTLEFFGNHISNAGSVLLLQEISHIIPFSFASDVGEFVFTSWVEENRLVSLEVDKIDLVIANFGTMNHGIKMVDISTNKCEFKVLDENMSITHSLNLILERDVEYLRETFLGNQKSKSFEDNDVNDLLSTIGDVSLDIHVNEFCWFIDILYPLKLRGMVFDNHFSWVLNDGISILESFVQKLNFGVSINKSSILEIENSQILNNIKFVRVQDKLAIYTSSSLGYSKFFLPNIIKAVEVINANLNLLETKCKQLKLIFDRRKNYEGDKSKMSLFNSVIFRSKFTNDYVGASTFIDTSKLSIELENLSLGVNNFESINRNGSHIGSVVPLYGYLSIPTTRVSIIDRVIQVGLSNVLDVNLSVKVYNDEEVTKETLSLQIESQYCRICLSPQILFKLVNIVDKLGPALRKLPILSKKKKNEIHRSDCHDSNHSGSLLLFSSIHVLCYNFCIGWLFEERNKDYPGIILGAERFFAVAEENIGKFTLMDAYLSVANGLRSSNFYSTTPEKENLNRALLPNMQIIYNIEGVSDSRNMRIMANGDELDVKFLSNSIIILEHTMNSLSKVQKFFNQRLKQTVPKTVPEISHELQSDYIQSFKSAFASIELIATFAGSNVLLYLLGESEDLNAPPSLFLHSPAIKIATLYKHQKDSIKKHIIKSEVFTSSSDNTLYASCMPVIMDIVQGIKKMMRKSNLDNSNITKKYTYEPAKDFDFSELLSDIDIHIGVRIERQKLTLSCEPTAKVATIVGIDGIYMQINTGSKTVPSITAAVQFDSISASLQHIYSREVSGYIGLKRILFTSSLKMEKVLSILSSGSFTEVEAYINVKQFQDLNLFKDIWCPESVISRYSDFGDYKDYTDERSELASNKNISSRFKEVSTTYAFPWLLTFMVFDISLRMDFGQSLGNFILKSDRIWVVSKKSTDWTQDLKLGVGLIALLAEGRLSGILNAESIFVHTSIDWKNDSEMTLDVPLILVSGAIDRLQLKLSFDYHVFAIANFQGYSIDIFNKKNELSVSKDHLFVTTKFDNAELYITSLAASNILDIYNAIMRMTQENKTSYKETLRDSSRGKSIGNSVSQRSTSHEILETIKRLETKIELKLGKLLIHVYPSSFSDSKVLVVTLDESVANFQQNEYNRGISNQLDIQFNDLNVSLSMGMMILEDFTQRCAVNEFVEQATKASGGTIFVFPSFKISMRTFQKYQTNVIEYLYQSSFGKSVDIRWNLGSIIFIREMYAIHAKALASRTEYKKGDTVVNETNKIGFKEDIFTKQLDESISKSRSLDDEDPANEIDQAINDTLNKVSSESKFTYLPLAPPIIEAPQLKELGNATPPLEWFGLHRNKFPNATHQMGIVSLQKLIHEIELQYSKILGKA